MVSLQKRMILTPLQLLPKNGEDWGKLIVAKGFKKLPKVQNIAQSGHTGHMRRTRMCFTTKNKENAYPFYDHQIVFDGSCKTINVWDMMLPSIGVSARPYFITGEPPSWSVWPDDGIKSGLISPKSSHIPFT